MIKHILKQIGKQSALLVAEAERIALEVQDKTSPALLGKSADPKCEHKAEIDDDVARFLQNH